MRRKSIKIGMKGILSFNKMYILFKFYINYFFYYIERVFFLFKFNFLKGYLEENLINISWIN